MCIRDRSIAVAPAVATDGNEPIFVAIKGIVNIAKSSLETFDRNAGRIANGCITINGIKYSLAKRCV